MSKVLVIDDEAAIRDLVCVYLTASGFEVESASDGAAGIELFDSSAPDLVVLDVMLPGRDGYGVLAHIREGGMTPVIMLTARGSDLDKVSALEGGADDYVVKPFSPPELVARVRALLRRAQTGSASEGATVVTEETINDEICSACIEVGGLCIRPASREVEVDGRAVHLTAREFDLLVVMAARPGIVYSREQLLEHVLGLGEYVDERGVDVHVRHLRKKLGDDAGSPRFIETVRGVGYRVRRTGP